MREICTLSLDVIDSWMPQATVNQNRNTIIYINDVTNSFLSDKVITVVVAADV